MSMLAGDGGGSLVVDGKTYNLSEAPSYQDAIVQSQVKTILGQLSLDDVTENLDLAVDLFFVAYSGAAAARDGSVRSEIADLQSALARLCNDCVLTMGTFQSETSNIITVLLQVYKWLTRAREQLAVNMLANCAKSSTAMSTAAKNLAERFTELQINTTKTRSKVIIEETDAYKRKEAVEQAEREIRAKQAAEKENQTQLVDAIEGAQKYYDEVKAQEDKASDKALVLGITSAITTAIGAGLNAYVAAQNPLAPLLAGAAAATKSGQSQPEEAAAQKDVADKQKESGKAQEELLAAKDAETAARRKVDELQRSVEDLSKRIGENEQDTTSKETELQQLKDERTAKQKELTTAKSDLAAASEKVKSLDEKAKASTAAYAAAGKALESIAKSTEQMAAAAGTAEESLHAEKMKWLQTKLELEKQKRASLVALAEYTEAIKNFREEGGAAAISVNSIHAAVDALGKIIGTLTNASLFWDKMSDYCRRMADHGFQQNIKALTAPDSGLSEQDRLDEYQSPSFMFEFLTYLAQWVAVNGLSGAYVVSAENAQKKAVAYLKENPPIEEAVRRAPELAKSLSAVIDRNLMESRRISVDLEQQTALLASR